MAKARTRQKRPTCNLPGCDRPVKCRGLCAGCYFYLQRGKDPERRAALEAVAEPPKRRGRLSRHADARPAAQSVAAHEPAAPAEAEPPQAPEGGNHDDVIATVCEACTGLGITRMDKPGTRHFHNSANGKTVELTDDGRVYNVELRRATQRQ